MKKVLAAALASSMVLSAATAYAGGPVIVVEEDEVVAEKPASSIGILPLILGGILLCAVICDGGEDEPQPTAVDSQS